MIQDLFNKENHRYEIVSDINLNGGTLTIPVNCILDFKGGRIRNGKVVLNNTLIVGVISINQALLVEIEGTYKSGQIVFDTEYNKLKTYTSKGDFEEIVTRPFNKAIVGSSSTRPTSVPIGFQYFDTQILRPIWWNGSAWIDSTGAEV